MNRTYFIDPMQGDENENGASPAQALKSCHGLRLQCGDTVLFRRGSHIRGRLVTQEGDSGKPITYGAYGEGPKPVFSGSVPVNQTACWVEVSPRIWRCTIEFSSEICNLVFNEGQASGNLRWSCDELKHRGEWHYTTVGETMAGNYPDGDNANPGILYLCSDNNPAAAWESIECVLWGDGALARGRCHIVLENLCFRNSGVHGFQETGAHDIVIRDCDFGFIGGAVWSREKKIRFGNAVEFWDGASDITVERCRFENIYDSGITHQGGRTEHIPRRLYFRENRFFGCGMAAYECREPSYEVYFERNFCMNSGGGFSPQGEPPPRRSEIYPQMMGHHIFIWRIDQGTQPGAVYIRDNFFSEAPFGTAIYSIIHPEDESRFIIDGNQYRQTSGKYLIRMNNRLYAVGEFERFRADTGREAGGRLNTALPCQL